MDKKFSNKNILVTGGAGFIAANLIKRLESKGANVYALIKKESNLYRLNRMQSNVTIIFANMFDFDKIKKELQSIKPHFVFHTATLRNEKNWEDSFKINTLATINLLKAANTPFLEKFIHFGSSFEYANTKMAFKESGQINPDSFLGICKASGSMLLKYFALADNLPVVILRIFHVYGFWEAEHRLVPTAIRNILLNKPISLTSSGFCHDFVFVDDVVDACILTMEKPNIVGSVFNIGSGKQVTNEDVVSCISDVIKKPAKLNIGTFNERPWDKKSWCADLSLANEKLTWYPKTDLSTGIHKTVEWYLNEYKPKLS